jgi:hypothetical protein
MKLTESFVLKQPRMKIEIILFTAFLINCAFIGMQGECNKNDCMVDAGPVDNCVQFINTTCENGTFITDRLAYLTFAPCLLYFGMHHITF